MTLSSPPRSILSLSDRAACHIQKILKARNTPPLGVRISLKTQGCSGMAYMLTYVDEPPPQDECIQEKGVTLYIDPQAILFLIGSEMDYQEDPIAPGFLFKNPNEKGRCGCGQSFHV